MLASNIIYPIRYSSWVANIIPVQKKNGDIKICIEFQNLNLEYVKDNYQLPMMDHILQTINGLEMFSLMDGYFGYNQIWVAKEDSFKIAFTTP